ncbi:MAG TPA: hypothetical protein VIV35_10425 [Chitinophagaceae bacterium]
MRTIAVCFILLFLSLWPLSITAQPDTPASATERLKKEQVGFLEYLKSVSIDSNIAGRLFRFIGSETDSIQKSVLADTMLPDTEKTKAIGSLMYFIQELCQSLSLQKFDIYDIPGALESYKFLLKAFLYHLPYEDMLKTIGPGRSQLLAAAFWQFRESGLLKDVAIYKRVVSSPDYVLNFLESFPKFRFADSLLLFAIDYNPLKIASRLEPDKSRLEEIINNKQNIYLQKIVFLSKDPNASELLPFIMPLAENRMTSADIIEKRKDATGYFQLLVNTLKKYLAGQADSSFIFLNPLRNALKEKAIDFYANPINELHGAADEVRFASVKGLRTEDIYYIITSCEDELYTSSYLGLYKRLMEHLNTSSVESLFETVQYDNFRCFIRMAANYNTLGDFLRGMPLETATGLLRRYVSGIESDTQTGLEKAMDVADAFAGFNSVPGISILFRNELKSNLDRCQTGRLYLGIRLYSILLKVFDLLSQKDDVNKLWSNLGNPELLERKALQNKYGEIIQLVLFYGDEDGNASFNNFINLFKDPGEWEITQNDLWVTIRSLSDQPIFIYANLPLDEKKEMDLLAQDSLCAFLHQLQAEPVILIHRGHSYHLPETLKRLQPSVKLTILGSCGGSNSIISVASISPDAQIIVSKKIGSQFINDPMIDVINETLQHKKDLVWTEVWEKLRTRFRKDEFALNLFNEYIPPSKNVSLFVLKLFNFYK